MHELIAYIKDWKLTQIQILIDNLNPDVMNFHDDWGKVQYVYEPGHMA
jgi:hypothetical protein